MLTFEVDDTEEADKGEEEIIQQAEGDEIIESSEDDEGEK